MINKINSYLYIKINTMKTEYNKLEIIELIERTKYWNTYAAYDTIKKKNCYVEVNKTDNSYIITY